VIVGPCLSSGVRESHVLAGGLIVIRVLPVLLDLGLTIFCLIECLQSDEYAIRNLPKVGWVLLILFFPIVGPVAWLVAGRPPREPAARHAPGFPEYQRSRRASTAPDDDPQFLQELGRVNDEHERTLKQWEADLARREQDLRRRQQEPPVP
jgi:Phospholipase_D-nuclease N-terminal